MSHYRCSVCGYPSHHQGGSHQGEQKHNSLLLLYYNNKQKKSFLSELQGYKRVDWEQHAPIMHCAFFNSECSVSDFEIHYAKIHCKKWMEECSISKIIQKSVFIILLATMSIGALFQIIQCAISNYGCLRAN